MHCRCSCEFLARLQGLGGGGGDMVLHHLCCDCLVEVFILTGTASAVMWTLHVEGRLFHSGLPHKGINSLELAMEAIAYVQNRFYQDYPPVSISY